MKGSFVLLLLLMFYSVVLAADIYISPGDVIHVNVTMSNMTQSDFTVLFNLCYANPTCQYARALRLGGNEAVKAFAALLASNPPSTKPIKNYYGALDVLDGMTLEEANAYIETLLLIVTVFVVNAGCALNKVPAILNEQSACLLDPSQPPLNASNNSTLVVFLVVLLLIVSLLSSVVEYKYLNPFEQEMKELKNTPILNDTELLR